MQNIEKKVLANGLTVLVRSLTHVPKVSVQLWYNVGSKDEQTSEKGIAHLIEHMLFKGTTTLSESDINMITHKLSGLCNAFTSYDYTGYLFDFPSQHWLQALPIMADCMRNCTFKPELLNSELKAVIQELKMYRDEYGSVLIEQMLNAIFPGHPYQHPIIGYKQDLWSLDREHLVKFYQKHYIPNNATLIVIGDVNVQEVFEQAEKNFGAIAPDYSYKKEEFFKEPDLISTRTVLYRDIQQPFSAVAWVVPGARQQLDYPLEALSLILGDGYDSRLYKKLVDELDLVTEIQAFTYDLFDYGLLFVQYEPKEGISTDQINAIIQSEIHKLGQDGPDEHELLRAMKKVEVEFLGLLESNQKQAYAIGKTYLATGDEHYIFNYLANSANQIKTATTIKEIITTYLRPSFMHSGSVERIAETERAVWSRVQEESDALDQRVLSKKSREGAVEEGMVVHSIAIQPSPAFTFPRYKSLTLSNGLEVISHHNPNVARIELMLEFKTKHFFDPLQRIGIGNFVSEMLQEGTQRYPTSAALAQELESYGMNLRVTSGYIGLSLLSADLPKGLELLHEILVNSILPEGAIEKVRNQLIAQLKNYWDTPAEFSDQLVRDIIYKDHPYSKNLLGTFDSLAAITRDELLRYFNAIISPHGARLAIVGDLQKHSIETLIQQTLGGWFGQPVSDIIFPAISSQVVQEYNYPINRDQVVLTLAKPSISRLDVDYDKLLVFEQIFGGGVLGSMSSRLFQLRERYGLFYTIAGSLIAHADEQPGMNIVKTIVSLDRLDQAEELIKKEIDTAADVVADEEFLLAKNALINARIDNFVSNKKIAATLLYMRRFNLPQDYFDNRAAQIQAVSKQAMQEAAQKILTSKDMVKVRVGRIT